MSCKISVTKCSRYSRRKLVFRGNFLKYVSLTSLWLTICWHIALSTYVQQCNEHAIKTNWNIITPFLSVLLPYSWQCDVIYGRTPNFAENNFKRHFKWTNIMETKSQSSFFCIQLHWHLAYICKGDQSGVKIWNLRTFF